jgi:hypothetical protein
MTFLRRYRLGRLRLNIFKFLLLRYQAREARRALGRAPLERSSTRGALVAFECEVLWQTGTVDLLSVSVRIDHVPDPFPF